MAIISAGAAVSCDALYKLLSVAVGWLPALAGGFIEPCAIGVQQGWRSVLIVLLESP